MRTTNSGVMLVPYEGSGCCRQLDPSDVDRARSDRCLRCAPQLVGGSPFERWRLSVAEPHTEFCLTFASVEALKGDYELMSVTDAVGGRSQAAHHTAGEILVRAGAVPTTPLAVPTELFRDGVTSHTGPTRDVNYGRFTEVAKHTVEVGVAEDENG
jgi:hypothetical protein